MDENQLKQQEAILNELKTLNKTIQEEMKREESQRVKQATIDSEQAEILAEDLAKEKEVSDQKEEDLAKTEESRHLAVIDSLEKTNNSITSLVELTENGTTDSGIQQLNSNIEKLIEYQENGLQSQVNNEFLGSTITVILIVAVAGFALIKVFGWIGSKIANMIFY